MVVVMYSLPYSFDFHSNWLAVGIFPVDDTHGYFDKIHSGPEVGFKRKQFYHNTHPVIYRSDSTFEFSAKMGSMHKESITVKIYPKQGNGLAQNLKSEKMREKARQRGYLVNLGRKISRHGIQNIRQID